MTEYSDLNDNQKRIFLSLKSKGFQISPEAIITNNFEELWEAEGAVVIVTTTTTTEEAEITTTTTTEEAEITTTTTTEEAEITTTTTTEE